MHPIIFGGPIWQLIKFIVHPATWKHVKIHLNTNINVKDEQCQIFKCQSNKENHKHNEMLPPRPLRPPLLLPSKIRPNSNFTSTSAVSNALAPSTHQIQQTFINDKVNTESQNSTTTNNNYISRAIYPNNIDVAKALKCIQIGLPCKTCSKCFDAFLSTNANYTTIPAIKTGNTAMAINTLQQRIRLKNLLVVPRNTLLTGPFTAEMIPIDTPQPTIDDAWVGMCILDVCNIDNYWEYRQHLVDLLHYLQSVQS